MRDSGQLEEMNGAVGLGLLASAVVRTLARLSRGVSIDDSERSNLVTAKELLDAIVSPGSVAERPASVRFLASSGSTMDALSAVESRADTEGVTAFLLPLAATLGEAIDDPAKADATNLLKLRELFAAIGDAEVSHVSRLSRPSAPSSPLWSTATPSSVF